MNRGSTKTAVFGGGCFWCTEEVFSMLKGVVAVIPGYAGGVKTNPTYEEVCNGSTGHAEVIKIEYDPATISYEDLLTVFFYTHDPTTPNRQGNDIGTQYRSIILYTGENQKKESEEFIKNLKNQHLETGFPSASIVTKVKPLDKFYEAEDYHKEYFKKNPEKAYCQLVIAPKVEKLEKRFKELLR